MLTSTDLDAQHLAASQLADQAIIEATLSRTAPCADGQAPSACLEAFGHQFGLRAWRRPLADDDVAAMLALAQSLSDATYGQQNAGCPRSFEAEKGRMSGVTSAAAPLAGELLGARFGEDCRMATISVRR